MNQPRQRYGAMGSAVRFALRQLQDDQKTAGTRALARHYADLIDDAATPSAYADDLDALEVAAHAAIGPAAAKAIKRVRAALSATTVASDLGPKLLAALTALQGAGGGAQNGSPGTRTVESTIERLRRSEARRPRRAPAMDAPAPRANP
jgi:Arc/MetJ-type ribon-helix-helix transcriptional regulator